MNVKLTSIDDVQASKIINYQALRNMSDFVSNDDTLPDCIFFRDSLNDLLKDKDNGLDPEDQAFLEDVVTEYLWHEDDEEGTHVYPDMYRFS